MEHVPDPHEFDTSLDANVDLERPRPIQTPWGTMALFRIGGQVVCTQAFCPHLEGPLFQGSVAAGEVTCPWHLWRFDLRTGRRTDWKNPRTGPDARGLLVSTVSIGPTGSLVLSRPARSK
jgi:nitrite reductase/ring-hydroxylating ferredoxin subunit